MLVWESRRVTTASPLSASTDASMKMRLVISVICASTIPAATIFSAASLSASVTSARLSSPFWGTPATAPKAAA